MYMNADTIYETFNIIKKFAKKESIIVFDYNVPKKQTKNGLYLKKA